MAKFINYKLSWKEIDYTKKSKEEENKPNKKTKIKYNFPTSCGRKVNGHAGHGHN